MTLNPLKQAIAARQRQFGFWSALPSSLLAEIVALSGFDFVLFDMEHAPNDANSLIAQLQAIKGSPLQAMVRPPANDPVEIKRVLDIGFRSLLVPMVQNAEQAREAVRATRYPPRGVRGVSGYHRNNLFGTLPDYFRTIDQHICVVCQVETREAIDAIGEIAAVEGVDALFVGPGDLAASLGHIGEIAHREVQSEIVRAAVAAARAGKPIGIVAPDPETAARYVEMGYDFMTAGADIPVFRKGMEEISRRLNSMNLRRNTP